MKYTHYYQLEYEYYTTSGAPVRRVCTRHFETELERNKYALELFALSKEKQIILISLKETDVRLWETTEKGGK